MPAGGIQKMTGKFEAPAPGEQSNKNLIDVYKVISAASVTGEDLWMGNDDARPLIKHFNKELRLGKVHETTLVSFTFPKTAEFAGLPSKTYKVERMMPIQRVRSQSQFLAPRPYLTLKLVSMILGRVGVTESEKYTLSTLGGFVLPDNHRLADYGLGSLLPNWELEVVDKAEAERLKAEHATQNPAPPPSGKLAAADTKGTR